MKALARANDLGCDSIALPDLAPHVGSSEWIVAEAIEAYFRTPGRLI
jgi:hypothetical protein